ncbi:MAG: hypothetical protein ABII72_00790, partial [Parcubacteria group bacterium]
MNKRLINLIIILLAGLTFLVRLIPAIAQGFAAAGDSYMAVLWSRIIDKTGSIPDYVAIAEYWGKPGDIYFTPNLHIILEVTHLLTGLSFSHSVIFLSLLVGCVIPILLFAIARLKNTKLALIVFLLASAGLGRSLRYFTEPGYHFQNLFGDLIIVFLVYLFFAFLQQLKKAQGNKRLILYLALTLLTVNSLLFYHQLSSFIGLIILGVMFLVSLSDNVIRQKILRWRNILVFLLAGLFFAVALLFTGYESTIFQLFGKVEPDNSLYKLMRSWELYPQLLGNDFVVYAGMLGLIILIGRLIYLIRNKKPYLFEVIILAWLLVPLILSKAPLLYIKLLPMRLFWYIGYPLVVVAAYGLYYLIKQIRWRAVIVPLLIITFFVISFSSLFKQTEQEQEQEDNFYGADSSYTSEVQELNKWLLANVATEDVIYLDVFNYKSLIWTWSDVIPEKKVYIK